MNAHALLRSHTLVRCASGNIRAEVCETEEIDDFEIAASTNPIDGESESASTREEGRMIMAGLSRLANELAGGQHCPDQRQRLRSVPRRARSATRKKRPSRPPPPPVLAGEKRRRARTKIANFIAERGGVSPPLIIRDGEQEQVADTLRVTGTGPLATASLVAISALQLDNLEAECTNYYKLYCKTQTKSNLYRRNLREFACEVWRKEFVRKSILKQMLSDANNEGAFCSHFQSDSIKEFAFVLYESVLAKQTVAPAEAAEMHADTFIVDTPPPSSAEACTIIIRLLKAIAQGHCWKHIVKIHLATLRERIVREIDCRLASMKQTDEGGCAPRFTKTTLIQEYKTKYPAWPGCDPSYFNPSKVRLRQATLSLQTATVECREDAEPYMLAGYSDSQPCGGSCAGPHMARTCRLCGLRLGVGSTKALSTLSMQQHMGSGNCKRQQLQCQEQEQTAVAMGSGDGCCGFPTVEERERWKVERKRKQKRADYRCRPRPPKALTRYDADEDTGQGAEARSSTLCVYVDPSSLQHLRDERNKFLALFEKSKQEFVEVEQQYRAKNKAQEKIHKDKTKERMMGGKQLKRQMFQQFKLVMKPKIEAENPAMAPAQILALVKQMWSNASAEVREVYQQACKKTADISFCDASTSPETQKFALGLYKWSSSSNRQVRGRLDMIAEALRTILQGRLWTTIHEAVLAETRHSAYKKRKWKPAIPAQMKPRPRPNSGFYGVTLRDWNRWQACLNVEGKMYLGTFDTKEEAAFAYDEAIRRHYPNTPNLNFATMEDALAAKTRACGSAKLKPSRAKRARALNRQPLPPVHTQADNAVQQLTPVPPRPRRQRKQTEIMNLSKEGL